MLMSYKSRRYNTEHATATGSLPSTLHRHDEPSCFAASAAECAPSSDGVTVAEPPSAGDAAVAAASAGFAFLPFPGGGGWYTLTYDNIRNQPN